MKPKILTALLLITMIFNLTACGDKSAEKENGQTILTSKAESTVDESGSDTTSDEVESSDTESFAETSETLSAEPKTEQKTGTNSKSDGAKNEQPQSTQPPQQSDANSVPETTSPQVEIPRPVNASAADAEAIANKTIEYINQYRTAQGAGAATKIPGLTKVAQYRSNQLVTNYKHDNIALREAATASKYGEHVVIEETRWDAATQSVIKTGKILDYYDAHCGEAIGRSGGNASIDEIAQRMVTGFKNSKDGHWSFVGAAANKYISVGATYGNGQWYIAILMCEVNTYG